MTVHVRPPNNRATTIPVRRAGIVAAEFCKSPARAEVAAVFARSFYLRSDDLFVCIGEPAIGNGPLTLIADIRAARLGLHPRQPARIADNRIAIGTVTFTCEDCEPWHPPPWPPAGGPHALAQAHETIVQHARTEAPAEGFGRAMTHVSKPDHAFARTARRHLAHLHAWLAKEPAHAQSAPRPVHDIVGMGHGLTPSGDDVLVGALALLDALGERRAHARLAGAISLVPAGLTSPLSHCFLRVAAAGHVGAALHDAVSSLVRGDAGRAIAAIRDIGHSSGWDMMAGVITALDAVTRDYAALRGR